MAFISIFQDSKLHKKLCVRLNRTFGCQEAFDCHIACPLWIAFQVEALMNDKNIPLGEAYRLTLRQGIDELEGRRIMRDIMKNKNNPYPIKSLEEIKVEAGDE